jgi:hypothetical protein
LSLTARSQCARRSPSFSDISTWHCRQHRRSTLVVGSDGAGTRPDLTVARGEFSLAYCRKSTHCLLIKTAHFRVRLRQRPNLFGANDLCKKQHEWTALSWLRRAKVISNLDPKSFDGLSQPLPSPPNAVCRGTLLKLALIETPRRKESLRTTFAD